MVGIYWVDLEYACSHAVVSLAPEEIAAEELWKIRQKGKQ